MKIQQLVLALVLAALSLAGKTYHVRSSVKLSELTPLEVNNAFDNGIERTSEGYRVCWNGKKSHGEFFLQRRFSIKDCTAMRFKVIIYVPAGSSLNKVTLRLVDNRNEVFQIPCPVHGDGLQTLEYTFLPAEAKKLNRWPRNPAAKIDGVMDFPLQIMGLSFSYRQKGQENGDVPPGWFELRSIEYETDGDHEDHVAHLLVEIDTGSPLHLLKPGDGRQPLLRFRNPLPEPCRFQALLKEAGYDGMAPYERSLVMDIAPYGETSWALPRIESLGVRSLRLELQNMHDTEDKIKQTLSYAVMEPTGLNREWSADDFKFTICSHPDRFTAPERWEMEALAMETVGARYLRHGCSMDLLKQDGTLDTSQFDAITDVFARHGIHRLCCVGYTAKWAAADLEAAANAKNCHALAPQTDYWRSYLRQLFRRERDRIGYWELWNEADLPEFCMFDAATYAELAQIAREELDAAKAGILMSSGFALLPNRFKPDFQEEAMRRAGQYFDVHCFHGHGIFERYVDMIDGNLIPMRRKLNLCMPWYAHETALTSAGHGEDKQADALYQKLLFSWARGSIGYTWYNLVNKGNDPHNGEHNYGMLDSTFHPKPVYVAYNTLTSLFGKSGTRFVRQFNTPEGNWLFEFSDGHDSLLAYWNEEERENELAVTADCNTAELIDLMGNRRVLQPQNGIYRLNAGQRPITLRFNGMDTVKAVVVKPHAGSRQVKLPIGHHYAEQPLFVLDQRSQVYSRFDAMPEHVDKVWKSADDLSLKAWVAVDNGIFKLKVAVTDDVHRQPFRGEKIWQGDSVQFFLHFQKQRSPWELGMALDDDGIISTFCWNAPLPKYREQAGVQLKANIWRKGTLTMYEAEIPLAAMNMTEEEIAGGFCINIQVNDDDTGQREGWISLIPPNRDRMNYRIYPWLMLR